MRKKFSEYTIEELDTLMQKKWDKMRSECPDYNSYWLYRMHELIDWYEEKKALIKK